jgi:thiamine biosynthesis lipoprotein
VRLVAAALDVDLDVDLDGGRRRWVEPVMGTVATLLCPAGADDTPVGAAFALLHQVDATFSTYRADSDVSRLGRGEARVTACAPEVAEVLALCAEASARTDGYFTACPAGRLDPSGLVKGWSVDRAIDLLRAGGATDACLDVGGDLRCLGSPVPGSGAPWRAGIADPHRSGAIAAACAVPADGALATSGPAERGPHILDPFTGRPATHWASLSIIAPALTWADAYATAAVAMGPAACRWLDRAVSAGWIVGALGITADGGRCRHGHWPA